MKRLIAIITILALLAAGCGSGSVGDAGPVTLPPSSTDAPTTTTTGSGPDDPSTTTTTQVPDVTDPGPATDQVFVELFFVSDGVSAQRVMRAVDTPAVAANALRTLIEGPTSVERDAGLSTSIPADTLLLGLTIENGLATVDLSREFEVGGGSLNILSRLAQVVYTLTQFPTVDEVLFRLDGKPVEVFSGEGVVLGDPVGRSDYATILPIEPKPDNTVAKVWHQTDLPDTTSVAGSKLSRVALVEEDDVLNVRQDPTAESPILGMLVPDVVVIRTGLQEVTGSSIWEQIETPLGQFWVNGRFLAAVVSDENFASDPRVPDLLDRFAAIIAADDDLRPVTSRRGLYVSHHGDPIRFSTSELSTILTDPATYKWPSNALSEDDPEFQQIPGRTFAQAVADSFLSAYDDSDTTTTINQPIEAGNGRLAEYAIPFEFESFNYIGVHDPGDNPDYGGLDWVTWYVSIDYEDGAPVIVGLTIDMWSP
ncbi:MAG: GerMN domain-containing protein [Acidimicrobiia bacterium]|nr:GerMN domain-containing protein [Acidimicrobiia bacterium]